MLCLETLLAGFLHLRLSLAISSCDIHSHVNSLSARLSCRLYALSPLQADVAPCDAADVTTAVDDHEIAHLDTGDDGLRQDCLQNVHGL